MFYFKCVDAMDFAEEMHEGQVRKYTGEEYVNHPYAVYELLGEFFDKFPEYFAEEEQHSALTAALLHDTVEDTAATIEDIEHRFGAQTAEYVWYMTKVPGFVGNRQKRKTMDAERLAQAPLIVKCIKFFDVYHNAQSIFEHDPEFTPTFVQETINLLAAMNITDLGIPQYKEFVSTLISKHID